MEQKDENKKGKSFTILQLYASVMFDKYTPYLDFSYWRKVLPDYDQKTDDKWLSFEDALNYIEMFSDYTLFQIVEGKNIHGNSLILLLYVHK